MLPLACVALTASCMQDEEGSCGDSGNVSVQLHMTADYHGDLNASRAMEADPNAVAGEFMNELCVFVVNASDNKIEWRSDAGLLDSDADAQEGNLTDYTFRPIELTTGAKKIYAFANWKNAGSDAWTAVVNKAVGETLTADELAAITIDDPAANVDIANKKFIPMSAEMDAEVRSSTGLLSIGLDRLVSKVRITVTPTDIEEKVRVKSLTFSGTADKVALLPGRAVTGVTAKSYEVLKEADVTGGSLTVPDFYVNETNGSNPFVITMTTDQYSGMTYAASTQRTEIPRNSIYPLTLTLSKYTLDLDMQAWFGPIGSYPIEYLISADGSYVIKMFEMTNKFTIKPTGLNSSAITGVTWEWGLPTDKSITLDVSDDNTLTGNFSAVAGYEYPLTLNAKWKDNGKNYDRTYNIIIKVTDDLPTIKSVSSRAAETVNPEIVNLFIKK